MKTALSALLLVSLIVTIQGGKPGHVPAKVYPECSYYQSCGAGACCRHSSNFVIPSEFDSQGCGGGGEPPFTDTGSCIPGPALLNENCGGGCQCAAGLRCYRQMAGQCGEPQRCYDAVWVQEQIDYWNNCSPPDCYFPP